MSENSKYSANFIIKNEHKLNEFQKSLLIAEYAFVYNNCYCKVADEEYYEHLNKVWDLLGIADPIIYDRFVVSWNNKICNDINNKFGDIFMMKYKVDETDVNFVGVLKADESIEVTFYVKKAH